MHNELIFSESAALVMPKGCLGKILHSSFFIEHSIASRLFFGNVVEKCVAYMPSFLNYRVDLGDTKSRGPLAPDVSFWRSS